MFDVLRSLRAELSLPGSAKRERRRDRLGLPSVDPGIDQVVEAGIEWLGLAQDRSRSADGGISRHYSLVDGWSTSYPETTGYAVNTMLDYARCSGDERVSERARRMLEWLESIQMTGGGFQGGRIDSKPVVPVTFNTGQILLGLAAGNRQFGEFGPAMHRAASWLVNTQDPDGCWRKHPTPFARPGEKAYETHVAWGLIEAERSSPGHGYQAAALANARWALTKQRSNGWVENCCLDDPTRPLTHTLGYFLRGLIEIYVSCEDSELLQAATRTAEGLLSAQLDDGRLPGRLTETWQPAADYVCLTGTAQVAHCWLILYQLTTQERFRDAGFAANRFVRQTVDVSGPAETRGAVKGSFPVDGAYGQYEYLNWAVKFCIDSNMLERRIRAQ